MTGRRLRRRFRSRVQLAPVLMAIAGFAWTPGARAASQAWFLAKESYLVEWNSGPLRHHTYLPVPQTGAMSVDACFQIAPGGGAVAARGSPPVGLLVWDARGRELLRVPDRVLAFRFSPNGKLLALASPRELRLFDMSASQTRVLAHLGGVASLLFTDAGLVALVRGGNRDQLALIDSAGGVRTLAMAQRISALAAAKKRVAYFASGSLVTIDFDTSARSATKLDERTPVGDAELSADGSRLLFSTRKRVYLREGQGPTRVVAEADAHSIHFSPDGSSFLWATGARGELNRGGRITPLPACRSARFGLDGKDLIVTTDAGVSAYDPDAGGQRIVGGISPDDGENISGALLGDGEIIIYRHKSGHEKEHQTPTALPQ